MKLTDASNHAKENSFAVTSVDLRATMATVVLASVVAKLNAYIQNAPKIAVIRVHHAFMSVDGAASTKEDVYWFAVHRVLDYLATSAAPNF
mmetsp:Transcript_4295/g.6358  ORF Transcript_4295/g.6358 Transcript_4295/m.6358 type:complete len:91 (-) Transcript_4295:1339-1611(-)